MRQVIEALAFSCYWYYIRMGRAVLSMRVVSL